MTCKKMEITIKGCKDENETRQTEDKFVLLILLHADVNELKDEEH